MSRFNEKSVGTKTVNHEGAVAYAQSPKNELVSILLTSFAQDSFYEGADTTFDRLKSLLEKVDPKFAAKAAIYARTEFGMRSITHVLASELAKYIGSQAWAKDFYDRVIFRPDDMMEILSYHLSNNGKETNAMKKGFAKAIGRFDAYQLGKYRGEGKAVKLIDVVNICHPTPTEKNGDAIEKLVKGTLKSEGTWETKLTAAGKKAETSEEKAEMKKEAWGELIESGKIGQMALLRNLRNIIEQAPEMIDKACDLLRDEKRTIKSKIMPFRFYAAYKEIRHVASTKTNKVLDALADAIDISVKNINCLKGDTLISVDLSGSMASSLSAKSTMQKFEVGAVMAALLHKKSPDNIASAFGEGFKVCNLSARDSALTNAEKLANMDVGHSTNGYKAIQYARKNKIKLDNILIFSDMQLYDDGSGSVNYIGYYAGRSLNDELNKYRKEINPDVKLYSFDLAGYGSLQTPENDPNTYLLWGFSSKIFDLFEALEKNREAVIAEIEQIEL